MGFEIQNNNLNNSDITSEEKTALKDRRAMLMIGGDGQNPFLSWSKSGCVKLCGISSNRNLSLPWKEAALTCNYRITDTTEMMSKKVTISDRSSEWSYENYITLS